MNPSHRKASSLRIADSKTRISRPLPNSLSILEIGEDTCKNHLGEKGFCGQPTLKRKSYCADCQPKMLRKEQPKPYKFNPDYQPKNYKYEG